MVHWYLCSAGVNVPDIPGVGAIVSTLAVSLPVALKSSATYGITPGDQCHAHRQSQNGFYRRQGVGMGVDQMSTGVWLMSA